jgi:hypothetical protein
LQFGRENFVIHRLSAKQNELNNIELKEENYLNNLFQFSYKNETNWMYRICFGRVPGEEPALDGKTKCADKKSNIESNVSRTRPG